MSVTGALRNWWCGRITVRLISAVFALALITACSLGYLRYLDEQQQLDRTVDQVGATLVSTASVTLPDAIINEDLKLLEHYCKDLIANPGIAIVFVSVQRADGKMLAEKGVLPDDPGAFGIHVVTAPALLRPEGKVLGRTTIGLDVRQTRRELRRRAVSLLMQNFIAAVLIAMIMVVLLQRIVGRPLHELDLQAERIGLGDLDRPVTIANRDELGRLAATLEQMRRNLRASQDSLRQQNQQLLALDRLKDEFLANISHEIRTPLQAILGNSALLADASREQGQECVTSIERNANHLLGLVNQMLDFSKLQTGNLSVEQHRTELQPMLEDIATCLRAQAAAKGLRLEVRIADDTPRVLNTDPLRLRQILMNLVGNALKFTDLGSVTIAAAPAADGRLEIKVIDTGVGISESRRAKLFQPFVTGDPSLTRKHGGAGLGLVISRELAHMLGGDVTISSREGHGSSATVVIDPGQVDENAARPRAESAPIEPIDGAVLLVDDAADNRKLLTVVLRKAGLTVTTAENGEEACTAFAAASSSGKPFDIVLMDVQMPVLDGRAAAQRLRAEGCKTPLIALTAHATARDQELCKAAGFDEYATKPIAPRQLTELVRRQLLARRGQA